MRFVCLQPVFQESDSLLLQNTVYSWIPIGQCYYVHLYMYCKTKFQVPSLHSLSFISQAIDTYSSLFLGIPLAIKGVPGLLPGQFG